MSALRRFEVKIGDFATKCRSGFWHGAGEQKRMLRAARQNVGSKPPTSVSHAAPFVPFGAPPRDRRGVPVFLGLRRGKTRERSPLSRSDCRSNSSRSRGAPASETRTTVRRDGRVFYRSAEPTTHAAGQVLPFAVPLAGKRVVLSGKTWAYLTGPAARSDDLVPPHAGGRAEIFERLGAPSCLKRLLTKAGRRWKKQEGTGRPKRKRCRRLLRRFARRGFFAPTGTRKRARRPAERSVARTALA